MSVALLEDTAEVLGTISQGKSVYDFARNITRDPLSTVGSVAGSEVGEWGGAIVGTAVCGPVCGVVGGALGGVVGGWVGSKVGSLIGRHDAKSVSFNPGRVNRDLFDKTEEVRGRIHERHSSNTLNVNPARTANGQQHYYRGEYTPHHYGLSRTADGAVISRFPMDFNSQKAYSDIPQPGYAARIGYGNVQLADAPNHASTSTGYLHPTARA